MIAEWASLKNGDSCKIMIVMSVETCDYLLPFLSSLFEKFQTNDLNCGVREEF